MLRLTLQLEAIGEIVMALGVSYWVCRMKSWFKALMFISLMWKAFSVLVHRSQQGDRRRLEELMSNQRPHAAPGYSCECATALD